MRQRSILLLAGSHLYVDMHQGLLPGLLPFLVASRDLSFQEAAGLIFAANIFSSIIQPLFGYWTDKSPAFSMMPAGIILAGLGLAAVGVVSSYWALFAAVAISGIGIAAFHPEAARLTNRISGERKGAGLSTFTAGGNIGIALGPLVAVALVGTVGLTGIVFLAIPAIAMAGVLITQRLVLQAPADMGSREIAEQQSDEWGSFSRLIVLITLRSIVVFGINAFLPLYWVYVLHQSAAAGSSMLTLIFLLGAVSSLAAGRLADRFGHSRMVRAGFILLLPALFLFLQVRDVILASLLLVPVAVALFISFSPMVVLGQKYLPNHMGLASGITLGLAVSSGGTVSPLLGYVADTYGLETTFGILAFLPLLAVGAAFLLPTPRVDLPKEIIPEKRLACAAENPA